MEQLPRIARERLAQQHANSEHPEADVLAAFIERSLRGPEREHVLAHLASCAECRDVVALSMPDIEPELTNVQPQRRAWYEWSAFRFGGLAAALTVVVIAVVLFRPQARQAKEAATPAAPAANVAPGSSVTSSDAKPPAPANAPAPSSALHDDEKATFSASAREQDKLARSLKKDVPLPPPPEQRGEKRLYLKGAAGGTAQGDRDKFPDRQYDKDAADALAKLDSVQNKAGVFGGVAGANVPGAGAASVHDGKAQSQENQVSQQNEE